MAVTDIFTFATTKKPLPVERYIAPERKTNTSRTGTKFVRALIDVLEFSAKLTVAFPQIEQTGFVVGDMINFIDTHMVEEFRYMPYTGPSLRREVENIASDTGDTVFAFNHKHLDATSVQVYKDAVLVDPADYTFSGNDTAPIVTFDTSPDISTIRLEANFLIPVLFSKNPGEKSAGIADAGLGAIDVDSPQSFSFELIETAPGARFVNPTGMVGA